MRHTLLPAALSFLHSGHAPPLSGGEKETKHWPRIDEPSRPAVAPACWPAGYIPDYLCERSPPWRELTRRETGVQSSQAIMSGNEERSTALGRAEADGDAARLEKRLVQGREMRIGKATGVPRRFSKYKERVCLRPEPSSILNGAAEGSNWALIGRNMKMRLAAVRAMICSLRVVCWLTSGSQPITVPKAALLMPCSSTHNRSAGL